MKKVRSDSAFPDKLFVTLGILVFLMAGSSAHVRGQDLSEPSPADEGGASKAKSGVRVVAAGNASGSGHVTVNRRTYLRPHPERDSLTNHYFGLGPKLNEVGIESTLNLWMLYQGVVKGGLETDDGSSGFYYFSNHFDLEKMFGLQGASVFARVDSSCGDIGDVHEILTFKWGRAEPPPRRSCIMDTKVNIS